MHELESLEQRDFLSAPYDFAAVGVRYDAVGGPAVFLAEGVLGADDSITGTTRLATLAGAGPDAPIDWTHLNRLPHGAITFDTRNGFTPYASQTGTQFIRAQHWVEGSLVGRDAQGEVRDLAFLGQPWPANNTEDFGNIARFGMELQMLRLGAGGQIEAGSVLISGDPLTQTRLNFTYLFPDSGPVPAVKNVASVTGGRVVLDTGEVLFLTDADGGVLLADLDSSDGIVGIATGRTRVSSEIQNGRFRGAIVVTAPESAQFFGLAPSDLGPSGTAVASIVMELTVVDRNDREGITNTFAVYRQDEFDAGMRNPVSTGHWVSAHTFPTPPVDFIRLSAGDGTTVTIRHTHNRTLFFDELTPPGGSAQELGGIAGGVEYFGNQLTEFLPQVDAGGRPVVYEDARFLDDLFTPSPYSIDLIYEVGGEPIRGELVTWRGPESAHYFAGLSASGDVQVWRFDFSFGWTYTNLTQGLTGARPIAGDLFAAEYETDALLVGNSSDQFLAGNDADGNFVVYHQFASGAIPPADGWGFIDAEADSAGGAGSFPDFPGALSGWISGWNGANFAGIDSTGQLWVLWSTPVLPTWQATNLTQQTGGPTFVGAPTAVRTTWDTFHIHALDESGNLIVTWWAQGFDNWHVDNLTALFDGPALEAGSLTSNFSLYLDNINIVGRDAQGQAAIYWWSPGTGWHAGTISASVPSNMIPLGPWQMTSTTWLTDPVPSYGYGSSQSLLGHNADGHLVRLTWVSYQTDAWMLQDMTALSVPYFG